MLQTNTDQANIETKVRAVSSPVVANRNSTRVPWRCVCTDAVLLPQSSDRAEFEKLKKKEKQKKKQQGGEESRAKNTRIRDIRCHEIDETF